MTPRDVHTRLAPLLRPLALPYALLMAGRRAGYRRGLLPVFTPACPCVAIGNIAWGGTGKTPFTAWLLDWSRQRGVRTVVLTRGYGGNPGDAPLLVRTDTRAAQSGDEALMLARAFPESPVLVFPKRCRSARYAQDCLNPELFLLDDGMQHLRMGRHADIILLRPEDLEDEWNRVMPAGAWREGASALAAATVFAIKADARRFESLLPLAEKRLARFGRGLFSFTLSPCGLRPLDAAGDQQLARVPAAARGRAAPLEPGEHRGRPYILMSGVGNPGQVEDSARELMGHPPLRHLVFADHHPYSAADVRAAAALSAAATPVVCTAKDAVKLREFGREWGETPVWIMETRLRFGPHAFSRTTFPLWWEQWWRARPAPTP
jgi:tetraacyldisaccharide 4'-kinase